MASAAISVAKNGVEVNHVASKLPRSLYKGPVYAQGRIRNPMSKAARKARADQIARIDKYVENATHGQDIYVYNHIQTNQVIYSLTRVLNHRDALSQLMFVGKKSLPPRLRKDHWAPFLHIQFPDPTLGLAAYKLLREFRHRHEVEYDVNTITVSKRHPFYADKAPKDPKELKEWEKKMTRKDGQQAEPRDRKQILMDQKANTVADVAKVLELQTREVTPEDLELTGKKYEQKEGRVSNKEAKRRIQRHEKWVTEETSRTEALETMLEPTREKWKKAAQRRPDLRDELERREKELEMRREDIARDREKREEDRAQRIMGFEQAEEEFRMTSEEALKQLEADRVKALEPGEHEWDQQVQQLDRKITRTEDQIQEGLRIYPNIVEVKAKGEDYNPGYDHVRVAIGNRITRLEKQVSSHLKGETGVDNTKALGATKKDGNWLVEKRKHLAQFKELHHAMLILKAAKSVRDTVNAIRQLDESRKKELIEKLASEEDAIRKAREAWLAATEAEEEALRAEQEAAELAWQAEQEELIRNIDVFEEKEKEWRRKVLELEGAIAAKKKGIIDAKAALDLRTTEHKERFAAKKAAGAAEEEAKAKPDAAASDINTNSASSSSATAGNSSAPALPSHHPLSPLHPRAYTLKDPIRLLWANLTDASYASSWPQQVLHGRIGAVKHRFSPETRFKDQLQEEGFVVGEAAREREIERLRAVGYDVWGPGRVGEVEIKGEDGRKAEVGDEKKEERPRGAWQWFRERAWGLGGRA